MKLTKYIILTSFYLIHISFTFPQKDLRNGDTNGVYIFVNAVLGSDSNDGSKDRPLRTLNEAANKVNN